MKTPLEFFAECPIPHIIIGGHAVRALGYERMTSDWDFMIAVPNALVVKAHVEAQGYREMFRTPSFMKFKTDDGGRGDVDVMTVDESTFAKIWAASEPGEITGISVRLPAPIHLIALKLHAMKNNPFRDLQDMQDIIEILRAHPDRVGDADLEQTCQRYGPRGCYERILQLRQR
jgi:hypothetical protein